MGLDRGDSLVQYLYEKPEELYQGKRAQERVRFTFTIEQDDFISRYRQRWC